MFNLASDHSALHLPIVIFSLALGCLALNSNVDPVRDRCTRWHHASMLRGTSVFVDGGVELFRNGSNTWLGFSQYIFEIDMSNPWDATTNYTEKKIGRFGNSLMGANPPNMVRGALFRGPANDSRLYTFGGSTFLANTTDSSWQPPSSDKYSLWSYDTSSMTWGQYDVTYAIPRRPNWGAITEAVALGIGFILNGQVDKGSDDVMYSMNEYVAGALSNATNDQATYLGGLLIIDMGTQKARNVSTATLGPPRVAGGLIFAPKFGKTKNGTLVAFGGMTSAGKTPSTFHNGALIGLDTIFLCDSWQEDNPVWFNQPASGDIPPPRIDFCVLPGPKIAPDNSSHHFYICGGYDPINNIMYDDVYVLSLPSFTWTKLYSGQNPRFGHTCHSAGKRQMMSVGGSLNESMYGVETTGRIPQNLNTTKCDPLEGVMLFDLTAGTWGTYFNGVYGPDWQVPQKVVAQIGGSGTGGATMNQPAGGFVNPAIYSMFHPPPSNLSQSSVTPSDTTIPSTAASPHDPSIASIAGGVIGAILGSFFLLGLAIFLKRRRTKHQRGVQEVEAPSPSKMVTYQPGDAKELAGEDVSIQELKGSLPPHELPGEVHDMAPAELESPSRVHEKDGSVAESPVLPREGLGDEGTSSEGSPGESPVSPESHPFHRRST